MNRALRIRRAALAAACAGIVTLSLGACQDDLDAAGLGPDGKPTAAGEAPSQDQEPNGIEKLSASEAYKKGTEAMAKAGSVREVREGTSDGASESSDLKLSARECVGKVSVADMGSWEIIRIIKPDASDADTWLRVDAKLSKWAEEGTGTPVPANVWMHGGDANAMVRALSSYCHHDLLKAKNPDGKLTKSEPTTAEGQKTLPVTHDAPRGARTFNFATTGPAYAMSMTADQGDTKAKFQFSDYGVAVGAKKPSGKVVAAPEG